MPDDVTAHLSLPYIAAAQAQKHVTHNEALHILDSVVQLAVIDRDLAAPPGSPAEGDRYIVAASPTGAWAGKAAKVAAFIDGAWSFLTPEPGWVAFVADEATLFYWDGAAWVSMQSVITALQNLTLLGVGATADATNPFSAKLNKALWTARTAAEGGDGDLRYAMNKETASDVVSLLLQTGYSGRAEIGLAGDDDLVVKSSADGSSWVEALRLDKTTGGINFLAAETSVASAATCDLGAAASFKVAVTGTTTITSLGTAVHQVKLVRFAAALTLTHNATSLVLPGGANITTAAGDTVLATSDGSGNWRVRHYQKASGKPVTRPAAADISDASANAVSLITAANYAAMLTLMGITYETGSWTPTAQFATPGTSSFAYTTQIGRYVRIGKLVYLTWSFVFTPTIGTGSGLFTISGLPYSSTVDYGVGGCRSMSSSFAWPASRTQAEFYVSGGNSIGLICQGTNQTQSTFAAGNLTNGSSHTLEGSIVIGI